MNNKSLFERFNNISGRGPEKWLSRSLREDALDMARDDVTALAKQNPVVPKKPQEMSVTSGAEGGSSSPTKKPERKKRGADVVRRIREAVPKMGEGTNDPQRDLISANNHKHADARYKLLEQTVDSYDDYYNDDNIAAFREAAKYSDGEGALKFMHETLGMRPDSDGLLGIPERNTAQNIALGIGPGNGLREYFGAQYHDRLAFDGGNGEAVQHLVEGFDGKKDNESITDNDARKLHKHGFRDQTPLSHSEMMKVWKGLSPHYQKYLNGLGQPDDTAGVFSMDGNPKYEYFEDGDSQLDMDISESNNKNEHFKLEKPNDTRGQSLLFKILNSRFQDELHGLPFFGGFEQLTADHIQGRREVDESANPEDPSNEDRPGNLAITGKNLNQIKSGRSKPLGDDSINKLLHSPSLKDKSVFDQFFDEDGEGDINKISAWAAERFLTSHFGDDVDPLLSELGIELPESDDDDEDGIADVPFPVDINELMDMEPELLKNLMKRGNLNVANLTKAVPRKRENDRNGNPKRQKISKNTWRGASGNSYNGTEKFLDGFRKAMLVKLMTDVDLQTELESIKSDRISKNETYVKSDGSHKRGWRDEETLSSEIREAERMTRKKWANTNMKVPMQGHSSLYGLGRMDNKAFIKWFKDQGADMISGIQESHPELFESLTSELGNLDSWEDTLKTYVNGDQPYEFPQDDPLVLKGIHDEWGKQMMRSKSSREQLSEGEREKFFEKYKGKEDFTEPLGENWLSSSVL